MARNITIPPKDGSAVDNFNPKGVKLRKSPTRAVMAKLNPIEKVILSIKSNVCFLGKSASVKQ